MDSVHIFRSTTILLVIAVIYNLVSNGNSQIPMGMMKKQSKIKSTDDFFYSMVHNRPPAGISLKPAESSLYNRGTQTGFNNQAVSVMASQIATPDVCDPRPLTVVIPPDSDPRVMYWPTCTKLEQCGGCCGHELLECSPTSTEPVKVQVMKQRMSSEDSSKYDYMGNVEIELQRHLACECQCKIKPGDCNNTTQDYDEPSCTCRCRNSAQATSCQLPKRWNEELCKCVCPTLQNCLDDEYFDFNTCSCIRGSAVSSDASGLRAADPCASHSCRAGMKSVRVEGGCQCKRSRRSPVIYN